MGNSVLFQVGKFWPHSTGAIIIHSQHCCFIYKRHLSCFSKKVICLRWPVTYWRSQIEVNKNNSSLSLDFGMGWDQFGWAKWVLKEEFSTSLSFGWSQFRLWHGVNQLDWIKWTLKEVEFSTFLPICFLLEAPVPFIPSTGKIVVLQLFCKASHADPKHKEENLFSSHTY